MTDAGELILHFSLAMGASYLLGWWVYHLLKTRVIDVPTERSSHSHPTVRGGGIAIMLVVVLGSSWLAFRLPGTALRVMIPVIVLISVLSFIDDVSPLSSRLRFVCHGLAAIAALQGLSWPGLHVVLGTGAAWQISGVLAIALSLLWLTGYTNAFNFMDGINGLASGQALLTALGSGVLAAQATGRWNDLPIFFCFVVAGAAAGFLPHNFPKARMFMGDVSSAPLGLLLAALVLWLSQLYHGWLLIPLGVLHLNFVLDTSITLVRRILRGERWYAAHREHFYQRLVRSGKSHTFVTGCEMALQSVVLLMMTVYLRVDALARFGLIAAVFLIWLAFFGYCEFRFRRFGSDPRRMSSPVAGAVA